MANGTRKEAARRRAASAARPWIAACTALLAALALLPPLAEAQEPPAAQAAVASGPGQPGPGAPLDPQPSLPRTAVRLADLGFGDQRATGSRAVQDFFFPGTGDFQAGDGNMLTLDLAPSNLLAAGSGLTVSVNGRALYAVALDRSRGVRQQYVIPVPAEVLRKDFNQVRLEYLLTRGEECEDPSHPALYATVLPGTELRFDFTGSPPVPAFEPPNLGSYPYPFARSGYPMAAPIAVVVPESPTPAELRAAYRIAADLIARVSFDPALIELLTADEAAGALATSQAIVLGTPRRQRLLAPALAGSGITVDGESLARAGAPLAPEHALLLLRESPWNPALRVLVVSGATDAAVARGLDALTSSRPSALLAGPEAIVTEPVPRASDAKQPRAFTFGQLGFAERTVQGTTTDTVTVTFSAGALPRSGAGTLDLVLATPRTIDGKRSNLVVELNGRPVQTIQLEPTDGERVSRRVALPVQALQPGPNTLRLRTTLYAPRDGRECLAYAPERTWLTIGPESAIALPEPGDAPAAPLLLSSLPYPFSGPAGLAETVIVVDERRPASLRSGLLAAIALGRDEGGRGDFVVASAREATAQTVGDRHVVVAGVPADATILRDLEPALPLQLHPGGSRALLEQNRTLAEVLDASRLGVLQLARAPWAPARTALVVQGSDDQALTWASEALGRRALDGNVALFRARDQVNTFTIDRITADVLERELRERFTQRESLVRQIAAYTLVGGGAVLLAGLWALRRRLRFRP